MPTYGRSRIVAGRYNPCSRWLPTPHEKISVLHRIHDRHDDPGRRAHGITPRGQRVRHEQPCLGQHHRPHIDLSDPWILPGRPLGRPVAHRLGNVSGSCLGRLHAGRCSLHCCARSSPCGQSRRRSASGGASGVFRRRPSPLQRARHTVGHHIAIRNPPQHGQHRHRRQGRRHSLRRVHARLLSWHVSCRSW